MGLHFVVIKHTLYVLERDHTITFSNYACACKYISLHNFDIGNVPYSNWKVTSFTVCRVMGVQSNIDVHIGSIRLYFVAKCIFLPF